MRRCKKFFTVRELLDASGCHYHDGIYKFEAPGENFYFIDINENDYVRIDYVFGRIDKGFLSVFRGAPPSGRYLLAVVRCIDIRLYRTLITGAEEAGIL